MVHASFFSGIGGAELAAEWMGWENKFHCEINPFGQKVLKYYWPNSEHYSNIKESNFEKHRNTVDVLSGGFPCQPYSAAGKRLGKEDDRHLWPEMLRGIREIAPRWVVGENVRGLTNWNGGLVFDEVQADMEALGYEVFSFLLPACAVNAPHRRDRIFIVCRLIPDTSSDGRNGNKESAKGFNGERRGVSFNESESLCSRRVVADTSRQGLPIASRREQRKISSQAKSFKGSEFSGAHTEEARWDRFPTQSPIRSGNDGISSQLDGIAVSDWQSESIKAAGNAIVPQLIYQIFKAIELYEQKITA